MMYLYPSLWNRHVFYEGFRLFASAKVGPQIFLENPVVSLRKSEDLPH